MAIELRVANRITPPGQQMVEVWRDGVFVAGIYPHQDGIRITSKYMTDIVKELSWPRSAAIMLGKQEVKVG